MKNKKIPNAAQKNPVEGKLSQHILNDHPGRMMYIATTIGYGTPVHEVFNRSTKHGECYKVITDTGVLFVRSKDKKLIVTAYIATVKQLCALYPSKKDIPVSLLATVRRNEKQGRMKESEKFEV